MTHHDEDGIIGDRPKRKVDLGPLFNDCEPEAAAHKISDIFIRPQFKTETTLASSTPAPAPRAKDETQAFAGAGPVSDREMDARRDRIKEAVRQPLLDRAFLRKDLRDRKSAGVTAADVREIATAKGLASLVGTEQRAWSWLPTWLNELARQGDLVKWQVDGQTMKRINEANGNDQAIYLHPYAAVLRAAA